jgi:hypothetical protein
LVLSKINKKRRKIMIDELFKSFGIGRNEEGGRRCTSSCDVLWIIILLMVVLKGGLFGLDLCTLIILFIVFGKDLLRAFGPKHCGC